PAPGGPAAAPQRALGRTALAAGRPRAARLPAHPAGLARRPPPERFPTERRGGHLAQGRLRSGSRRTLTDPGQTIGPSGGPARPAAATRSRNAAGSAHPAAPDPAGSENRPYENRDPRPGRRRWSHPAPDSP